MYEDQEATEPTGEELETGTAQKYKIGETEYDEDSLKEALEAKQNMEKWQKSYTERDMALAEQRKSLEKTRVLEEFLNKNPDKYTQIEKFIREQSGEAQPNEPIQRFESELNSIKEQLAEREAMGEIEKELAGLKASNKEHFDENPNLEKELVKFAYEKQIGDMDSAFKVMMFDKLQTKRLEEGLQRGQNASMKSKSLAQPTGSKQGGKSFDPKSKSYSQIEQMIRNDPRYADM